MKVAVMKTLRIAKDFSRTPGPRYETEGDFSGEVFRKTILLPQIQEAIATGHKLRIELDGTAGYGTSFLEEAFGGLIRVDGLPHDVIVAAIDIVSDEEKYLKEDILRYMEEAANAQ